MIDYTEKFKVLVDTIVEYESDTFSAEGMKISRKEANEVANMIVSRAIQQMIDTETMSGVDISEELEYIRG